MNTGEHTLFLKWQFMVMVLLTVALIAYVLGFFSFLYLNDASKLSFLIIAIFICKALQCRGIANTIDKLAKKRRLYKKTEYERVWKLVEVRIESAWFFSGIVEKIGLTGTILGLLIAFKELAGVTGGDPSSILDMFPYVLGGIFTAFLTTLAGATASILLHLMHHGCYMAMQEGRYNESL